MRLCVNTSFLDAKYKLNDEPPYLISLAQTPPGAMQNAFKTWGGGGGARMKGRKGATKQC
jgi:hypothetical protein